MRRCFGVAVGCVQLGVRSPWDPAAAGHAATQEASRRSARSARPTFGRCHVEYCSNNAGSSGYCVAHIRERYVLGLEGRDGQGGSGLNVEQTPDFEQMEEVEEDSSLTRSFMELDVSGAAGRRRSARSVSGAAATERTASGPPSLGTVPQEELRNNHSQSTPLDDALQRFERALETAVKELDQEHGGLGRNEFRYRDECLAKLRDNHGFAGAKEMIVLQEETDPMRVSGPCVRRADMFVPLTPDVAVIVEFKVGDGGYTTRSINSHTGQLLGYMKDGQRFGFRHPEIIRGGYYGQGEILRYNVPVGFLVRFDKAHGHVPVFMRKVENVVN